VNNDTSKFGFSTYTRFPDGHTEYSDWQIDVKFICSRIQERDEDECNHNAGHESVEENGEDDCPDHEVDSDEV
jgi:hypothetical protein